MKPSAALSRASAPGAIPAARRRIAFAVAPLSSVLPAVSLRASSQLPVPIFAGVVVGVVVAALSAGCTGNLEIEAAPGPAGPAGVAPSPGAAPSSTPTTPTAPGATTPPGAIPAEPCDPARRAFAAARIWQLTDRQYVNVVRDVFGITLGEEDAKIVSAGASARYTNYSETAAIDAQAAQNYQTAAARVADLAQPRLATWFGTATPGAPAVRTFIQDRIARAWRRPLAESEITALLAIFTGAQADGPVKGVHLMLQAALQAPSFLYRTELGAGVAAGAKAPIALTPHELASALAFLFLESAPDDALWKAAAAGTLMTPAGLAAEVDRLLALPAARAVLAEKAAYWLGIGGLRDRSRNAMLFPEWTEGVKAALGESVQLFVADVLGNGKLADLFQSNRVFVNRTLARLYGIPGTFTTTMTPVAVAQQRSAGILTQPGFLVAVNKMDRGDVVHRGLAVNDAFVCGGAIPPAPPEAGDEAKKMDGTERERAAARAALPGCAACHMKFDPLGLTFERYDALGRYSETRQTVLDTESGVTSWQPAAAPVDARSVIVDDGRGDGLAGPIDGVEQLGARLAASPARTGACAARKLAEYAIGYNPDAENSCEMKAVKASLVSTGSFLTFFRALALSPGFSLRNPQPGM